MAQAYVSRAATVFNDLGKSFVACLASALLHFELIRGLPKDEDLGGKLGALQNEVIIQATGNALTKASMSLCILNACNSHAISRYAPCKGCDYC